MTFIFVLVAFIFIMSIGPTPKGGDLPSREVIGALRDSKRNDDR